MVTTIKAIDEGRVMVTLELDGLYGRGWAGSLGQAFELAYVHLTLAKSANLSTPPSAHSGATGGAGGNV